MIIKSGVEEEGGGSCPPEQRRYDTKPNLALHPAQRLGKEAHKENDGGGSGDACQRQHQRSPMPPPRSILSRSKPTNPVVWMAAILCAALAIVVFFTGVVVFAIYMIYQPKMPYLRVPYAHLNRLEYDQSGLLTIEMALSLEAENDNRKANASFSDVAFVLRFHGTDIAELAADPFQVAKNSSFALNYVVPASPIPLDEGAMSEMDASLKQNRVRFDLDGQARTRWRVGIFVSLRFWTHLSCNLHFFPFNGTSIDLDCSSKTH